MHSVLDRAPIHNYELETIRFHNYGEWSIQSEEYHIILNY